MALTRITKGVIKPNENYDTHNIVSTGIVTAIGLDINGNGDVSGDLNVGGVLTYEDVTSIDSVGLITARNGIDCNGDLDVDGHTNLDNVNIVGVTTTTGNLNVTDGRILIAQSTAPQVRINSSTADSSATRFSLGLATASNAFINGAQSNDACITAPQEMKFGIGNNLRFRITNTYLIPYVDLIPNGNNVRSLGNSNYRWSDLYSVDANISGDLNVDGHTNLDNVSIAGVTTTSDSVTIVSNRNPLINLSNSANYHLHLTNPNNDLNETVGIAFGLSTGGDIGAAITHEREGSTSFGNLRFYTKENNNPATMLERMRISKEGKVGIGTDNPEEVLHIQSGSPVIKFSDGALDSQIRADAANLKFISGGTSKDFMFQSSVLETSEVVRITGDGNVGIGTNNPVRPLHIHAADCRIRLEDAGVATDVELQNVSGDAVLTTNGASNLRLQTNNTERLRIDSDGDVIIGTTSWQYKKPLNVQGSSGHIISLYNGDTGTYAANTLSGIELKLRTGNTGNQIASCEIRAFKENGTNGDSARALSFYTGVNGGSPTERLRITSSGTVGVNCTPTALPLEVKQQSADGGALRLRDSSAQYRYLEFDVTGANTTITARSNNSHGNINIGTLSQFGRETAIYINGGNPPKVGINTNDPQEGLHVHDGHIVVGQDSGDGTNIRNYIKFGRVGAPKAAIGFINTTGNSRGDILFINSNASTTGAFSDTDEIVRFTREGKVGIGTDNPAELLVAYKTSNDAVIKTRTTGAGAYFDADSASSGFYGLRLKSSGTDKWFLGSYDSGKFTIKDGSGFNGTERFTILDTSGKVGITSTSPTGALDVRTGDHGFDGFIKLTKDANFNPSIEYYRTTGSGPTWYGAQLRLLTGDFTYSYAGSATLGNHSYSEMVRITQHGKVGISTSIANAKLEIGNVTGGYMNTSGIQVNRPHSLGLLNGIHVYTDAGYNPTASYRTAAFKATGTSGHAFACSTDAGSNGQGGTLNAKIDFDGDAHFLDGLGVGTASRSDGAKMEVFARGDTERGIYITDSDTTHNSPYLRVLGKRGDGNTHQSFSGRILLASLRTNAKINSGRKVGVIMFGGNHTNTSESNILYPASIAAVAGGSYDSATDMPTDLVFYTGSTGRAPNTNNVSSGDERLRIQSGGNVEMAQDVRLVSLPNSGNGAGLKVGGNGYGGDNTYGSMAVTNGNLHLDARNGSYGIYLNWYGGANGTYFGNGSSGQRGRIDGAGNLTLSGSYPGSDLRLKENIQNISGATDTIKSLVGKTFTWKTEAGLDDWKHYGFIAQEVQKVAPDLVKSIGCHYFDKDDKLVTDIDPTESDEDRKNKGITQSLTVNNEGVTPILVEAMKELIAKVETLEAKVSALEGS